MEKKMKKLLLLFFITLHNSYAIDFAINAPDRQPSIAGLHSVGDLNGDGYDDIFVSGLVENWRPWYCSGICIVRTVDERAKVLISNQKGGFDEIEQDVEFRRTEELNSIGTHNFSSVIADVDNDGDNDIVAVDGRVFLNNGSAVFSQAIMAGYPASSKPVYAMDFDNDGIVEILSLGTLYKRINVNPLEYAPINESIFRVVLDVAIADFNRDGFNDILTYGLEKNITIYFNNQTGDFSNANSIILSEQEPLKLVVGDIDNDNDTDIVLSNGNVLKNNSDSSFELVGASTYSSMIPHKLIKFNDDDYLDLFLTSGGRYGFIDSVLINDGEGNFISVLTEETNSLINQSENGVIGEASFSADFNADGFEDFVTLNSGRSSINTFNSLYDYIDLNINAKELNVYMNNQAGILSTNHINKTHYSKVSLFDFKNDDIQEILYSSYNNPHDNTSKVLSSQPFYISDIKTDSYKTNAVNLIPCDLFSWFDNVVPVNFNNDNFDDLLYVSNNNNGELNCHNKMSVLLNSESGFDRDNIVHLPEINVITRGDFKVADFNGDGFDDLINVSPNTHDNNHSKFYINNSEEFVINPIEIGDKIGSIQFKDINNDAMADIIAINEEDQLFVIYGHSDVDQLSPVVVTSREAEEFSFFDYNSDGFQDLFILEKDRNSITEFKHNGHAFNFVKSTNFGVNKPLENFAVVDLNSDGKVEVLSYVTAEQTDEVDTFYIYQLNDEDKYEVIYKDESLSGSYKGNYIFHDFDDDSLLDIVIGGKILFGRSFAFLSGLNYAPDHSGHGFSIENIGLENQFYTVFYTYGQDQYPEWYASFGMFANTPELNYWDIKSDENELIRFNYDYGNQQVSANTESIYKGFIEHNKCSEIYGQLNLSYGIGVSSFGIPIETADWCSEPIVGYYQRPKENLSGLWWAGEDDSGWGWSVSLVKRENTTDLILVLYYYDAEGNPRWLMGQQTGFQKGEEILVDMNMVKGYARNSTPQDLVLIPAGSIHLTLNEASHNSSTAGTMSMNVTYPGPEGGAWFRDNIPIALFSNPRND